MYMFYQCVDESNNLCQLMLSHVLQFFGASFSCLLHLGMVGFPVNVWKMMK